MEKNVNANTNANPAPETSPDQRHNNGERSLMASQPPAHEENINNPPPPTTIVVIELSSSSNTPPPPPVVALTADTGRRQTIDASVDVGTSSYGGGFDMDQVKKRGRSSTDVNNPEAVPKTSKKKGELTEVPKGEPRCATCNKVFKSWKALFGHLRSHPERNYRGALPPPTAAELDIHRCQQQLASTLLTAAQAVASRRRGLDIDLNQPSSDAADQSPSPEDRTGVGFDLNAEPPPESDDKH